MSAKKFVDSRSNRSRDIRAAHFVMDDDDAGRGGGHHIKGRTPFGILFAIYKGIW